jgi:deoxycytidylate deaminase
MVRHTCVLSRWIKMGIMFYGTGINEYQVDGKIRTIHAEINASHSIKRNNRNKKKKIYFCVLTTNRLKGDKFRTSRPCFHCLHYSFNECLRKGYIIKRYYFFNESNKLDYYTTNEIKEIIDRKG